MSFVSSLTWMLCQKMALCNTGKILHFESPALQEHPIPLTNKIQTSRYQSEQDSILAPKREILFCKMSKIDNLTYLIQMFQINLCTVICPTAKFHETTLLIVRKILNIHFTWTLINCWWFPKNFTRVLQCSFCHQCHFIISIPIVKKNHIRKPNLFRWHIQHLNTSIFFRIPAKFVIIPFLFHP